MPAAKIFLDWDTRKFFDIGGNEVAGLAGKNKSIRTYELAILQNTEPVPLPATSTVKAGVKKPADPPGTLLSEAVATRSGWATGSRWYFTLDLTNIAIDALFTGALAAYSASFEIYMELPDGQQLASVTVPFTIEKNVVLAP